MNQQLFHLSISSGDFHPSADALDLPDEVSGQPAAYFWKDMVRVGRYAHPTRKFSLAVDRSRLDVWAGAGRKMIAAGVPIPINCDHSNRARDVLGYVKDFRVEGDRLLALCQLIGDEAPLLAARNQVSVGIHPSFVDGQSRQWGEAIVHVALTPVPVMSGQGEFVQADTLCLSTDDSGEMPDVPVEDATPEDATAETDAQECSGTIACTAAQLAAIAQLIPGSFDITPDDCMARIIQHLRTLAAGTDATSDETDEVAAMSMASATIDAASRTILLEAAATRFDAAVARGVLTPASRDRLLATLLPEADDRSAPLLAFSTAEDASSGRPLALAIADILMENNPVNPGETTGLQALGRTAPGAQEPGALNELRQYMTRVAST